MTDIDKKKIIRNVIETFKQYRTPQTKSLCSRFFPKKENKNLTASKTVLELIFGNYFLAYNKPMVFYKEKLSEIELSDESTITYRADKSLKHKNNYSDCIVDTLLTDALKILRCNKIVRLNKREYILNLKYFYYTVRYRIKDKEVLQDLTPLMLSYLRSNVELAPHNFFKELDKLLRYVLQLPKSFNKQIDVEYTIYESIHKNELITILIDGEKKEILPLAIDIKGDDKELVYEEYDNDSIDSAKTKKIFLDQVSLLNTTNNTIVKTKEKAILAVNNTLFEYFRDLDYFGKIEIKKSANKGIQLFDYENPTKKTDFFIMEVEDTTDKIINTVQQNMPNIKVLSPSHIAEKIQSNLNLYKKNENIDTNLII